MLHILYTVTAAAAQEVPGIVIGYTGQDVELLCSLNMTLQYHDRSRSIAAWMVNNMGPYRMSAIRSGILTGYTATFDSNNLIVENIMMNDYRNGSVYICVIVPAQGRATFADIIDESNPIFLYVTGEYVHYYAY